MISGVVERVLRSYLGTFQGLLNDTFQKDRNDNYLPTSDYLDGIDSNNLAVGLWQGEVQERNVNLTNVAIKHTVTQLFNLPFKLIKGKVGLLKINVNIRAMKITIELDELNVLVGPQPSDEWSEQNERQRLWLRRQRALDTTDLQCEMKLGLSAEQQEGMYSKLVTRISDTLEITIKRVHIRYEDVAMEFFSGITLQSLRVRGTDQNWEDGQVDPALKKRFKKLDLDHLSVYWDADVEDQKFGPDMEWNALLHSEMNYVMYPVSGQLNLTQNVDLKDHESPRYHISGCLQSLSAQFTFPQYSTFRYFLGFMGEFREYQQITEMRIEKFYNHRPNVSVVGNAKAWWRYALRCVKISMVQEGVIEDRSLKGWDLLCQPSTWDRLKKQKEYTQLLLKVKSGDSSKQEIQHLEDLQATCDMDELCRWHGMAVERILKEQQKAIEAQQAAAAQQPKQGWIAWMRGDGQTDSNKAMQDALQSIQEAGEEIMNDDDEYFMPYNTEMQGPMLKLSFEIIRVGLDLMINDKITDKGRLENMFFGCTVEKDGNMKCSWHLGDLILESFRKLHNDVVHKVDLIKKAEHDSYMRSDSMSPSRLPIESSSGTCGSEQFHDAVPEIDRLFQLEYNSGSEKENPKIKFLGSKMILHYQRSMFAELNAFLFSIQSASNSQDIPERRIDPNTGNTKRFEYFLRKYPGEEGINIYVKAERRFDPSDHYPKTLERFIQQYGEKEGRAKWDSAEWRSGMHDEVARNYAQFRLDLGAHADDHWNASERRIDRVDHRVKTYNTFLQIYGSEEGRERWQNAIPAGSQAPSSMWYKKLVLVGATGWRMRELFQQTSVVVDVNLDAPIIILPTTFHDGPILCLHTGKLDVNTKRASADELKEYDEAVTKVDMFSVTLKDICLEQFQNLHHFYQFGTPHILSPLGPPFRMVENFEIHLALKLLDRDDQASQTFITGSVPSLTVSLDALSYAAFFQAIRTYSAGGLIGQMDAAEMAARTMGEQQTVQVPDAASPSVKRDDYLSDQFAGTHLNLDLPDLKIRFLFDARSGVVGRQAGGRCVELSTKSMSYRQVNHDEYMKLDFDLESLWMNQPNVLDDSPDKNLITTSKIGDGQQHFVKVNCLMANTSKVRATRAIPADTYVDIAFGTASFMFSPLPIRLLVKNLKNLAPNPYEHLMQQDHAAFVPAQLSSGGTADGSAAPARIANYAVNFSIENLSMICVDEHRLQHFANATMTKSDFILNLYETGTEFDGSLGNFKISDLSNKLSPQILGVKQGADYILKIKIRTYNENEPDFPGYNTFVGFQLVTIQFCLLMQKVLRIWNWIFEGFIPAITAGPNLNEQQEMENYFILPGGSRSGSPESFHAFSNDSSRGDTPPPPAALLPGGNRVFRDNPNDAQAVNRDPSLPAFISAEETIFHGSSGLTAQQSQQFFGRNATGSPSHLRGPPSPDSDFESVASGGDSPEPSRRSPVTPSKGAGGYPNRIGLNLDQTVRTEFSPMSLTNQQFDGGLADPNAVFRGSTGSRIETDASVSVVDPLEGVSFYKVEVDITEPTIMVPVNAGRSAEHVKLVVESFSVRNGHHEPEGEEHPHHRDVIDFDLRNVHMVTDSGYRVLNRVDIHAELHRVIEQGLNPHPPFQLICKFSDIPFNFTSAVFGVVFRVFTDNIFAPDPDVTPLPQPAVLQPLDDGVVEVPVANPSISPDAKWGHFIFILSGVVVSLEQSVTQGFMSSPFDSEGDSKKLAVLHAERIEVDVTKWHIAKMHLDVRMMAARLRSGNLPAPFNYLLARQKDKGSEKDLRRATTTEENIARVVQRGGTETDYELRVAYHSEPGRVLTKVVIDQPRIVFVWPVILDIWNFFEQAMDRPAAAAKPPSANNPNSEIVEPSATDAPPDDIERILSINLGRSRFILPEKVDDPNTAFLVFDCTAFIKKTASEFQNKWVISLLELEALYVKNWDTIDIIEYQEKRDYTDVDVRCITKEGNVLLTVDQVTQKNVPSNDGKSTKDIFKRTVHFNCEPITVTMGQMDVRAVVGCIDSQKALPEGGARFFGLRKVQKSISPDKEANFVQPENSNRDVGAEVVADQTPPDDEDDEYQMITPSQMGADVGGIDFTGQDAIPDKIISAGHMSVHSEIPSLPSHLSSNLTVLSPTEGRIVSPRSKPPPPPGPPPPGHPTSAAHATGSWMRDKADSPSARRLAKNRIVELIDDCEFILHQFKVCMVFDLAGGVACTPFLELTLKDLKTCYNAQSRVKGDRPPLIRYLATADVQIGIKYFNPGSVGWEPLIESSARLQDGGPSSDLFSFKIKRKVEPNGDARKGTMQPVVEDSYLAKKHREDDTWNIDSNESIIFNLSPVFLKSCVLIYWQWFEAEKVNKMSEASIEYLKGARTNRDDAQFTPYCVRNQTGMKVVIRPVVSTSSTSSTSNQSFDPIVLNDGDDVRLWNVMVDLASSAKTIISVEVKIVPEGMSVNDPGIPYVHRVLVNKTGIYVYPLAQKNDATHAGMQSIQNANKQLGRNTTDDFALVPDLPVHLIGRVVVEQASKLLVLQSPVLVKNNFEVPIEINLEGSSACSSFVRDVGNEQAVALPITGCQQGVVTFQPLLRGKRSKDPGTALPKQPSGVYPSDPVDLSSLHSTNSMQSVRCEGIDGADFCFVVVVRREILKYRDHEVAQTTIHLCAPVTIRSLLPIQTFFEVQCLTPQDPGSGSESAASGVIPSRISRTASRLVKRTRKKPLVLDASEAGTLHTNTKTHSHKMSVDADIMLRLSLYNTQWSANYKVWFAASKRIRRDANDDEKTQLRDKHMLVPDEETNTTKLKIVYTNSHGFPPDITIYAPFWLVNYAPKLPIRFSYPAQVHPFGNGRFVAQCSNSTPDGQSASVTPLDCDAQNLICHIKKYQSEIFPIGVVGFAGEVAVTASSSSSTFSGTKQLYVFGCSVSTYHASSSLPVRLVNIYPRYVVVNASPVDLRVRQHTLQRSATDFLCRVGEHLPVYWEDALRERNLQVKIDQENWFWSGCLPTGTLGSYEAQLSHETGPHFLNIIVEVRLVKQASLFIIIRQSSRRVPAFRIRNYSKNILKYRQLNAHVMLNGVKQGITFFSLAPEQEIDFAWTEPTYPKKLQLKVGYDVSRTEVDFEKGECDGYLDVQSVDHVDRIRYRVRHSGPTRVLTVFDEQSGILNRFSPFDLPRSPPFRTLKLKLQGIGLSLIGQDRRDLEGAWSVQAKEENVPKSSPSEILFIMIDQISTNFKWSKTHFSMDAKLQDLQVDNLRRGAYFPVILKRQARPQQRATASSAPVPPPVAEVLPLLQLYFDERLNCAGKKVRYIETLRMLVQDFDLKMDARFAQDMIFFCNDAYQEIKKMSETTDTGFTPQPLQIDIKTGLYRIHIQELTVHPINLSFSWSPGSENLGPTWGLNFLTSLTAVNNAALRFNSMSINRQSNSRAGLESEIVEFYKRQGMMQVGTLLGSSVVLGNPVGLIQGMATGFADAFYEPVAGAMHSPEAALDGMVRGTQSFSKNAVGSMFDSFANVTGSIATGVGQLSMDDTYSKRVSKSSAKSQPKNAGEGMVSGAQSLGRGIAEGFSGLVTAPLEGANKGGVQGFFEGGAKGVAGFFTKPVAGMFDMMSQTAEGGKNFTQSIGDTAAKATSIRLTRAMYGPDRVIRPYIPQHAQVMNLIAEIDVQPGSSASYMVARPLQLPGALQDLGLDNFVWDNGTPSVVLLADDYVLYAKSDAGYGWQMVFAVPIWQILEIAVNVQTKSLTLNVWPKYGKRSFYIQASSSAVLRGMEEMLHQELRAALEQAA